MTEEFDWPSKCSDILSNLNLDKVYTPRWTSHHASQKRGILSPSGVNTILPLQRDKVSTFTMQSHLMHLNMKWTKILNPNQTPVSDQTVYALTMEIDTLGFQEEFSKNFALFGELNIEQCILVIH